MGQPGFGWVGMGRMAYLHPLAHQVRVKPHLAGELSASEAAKGEGGSVSGALLAFKSMADAARHHLLHSYDAKGLKLALEECV